MRPVVGLSQASRCGKVRGREGGGRGSGGVHGGEMTEVGVEVWSCGVRGFGKRSRSCGQKEALCDRLRELTWILKATRSQKQVQSGGHCENSSEPWLVVPPLPKVGEEVRLPRPE